MTRGERDAQRFWLSVVDALAGAIGEDELVERVAASPAFEGEAVVERLLSDLLSLEQPVVLVIDDLRELLSEDALRWLELFVAGLPPELRLVMVTRQEPPLPLHALLHERTEGWAAGLRLAAISPAGHADRRWHGSRWAAALASP